MNTALIQKYNTPAPRYTSYPTVPLWDNKLDSHQWEELVKKAFLEFNDTEGISIYIHLPFCESLCTYCGCNKRITKNDKVKTPYIEGLLKEWAHYKALFNGNPKISGIHLGGGTPTFFDPFHLENLISTILRDAKISDNAEFSFEGHPNNTSFAHLKTLGDLGFDRVSYGIQDFDEKVQKAIHRIQPFEKVKYATDSARVLGYTSINFDLIYGLPHQTLESLNNTFAQVQTLRPDRIAFYSYAHLPSAFPSQRSFENYLPTADQKQALYKYGGKLLIEMGYEEIGMDHFALPNDPLCIAKANGNLHRNFMGYTTLPSKILIGLGASSISDVYYAYAQNEKNIGKYESRIQKENHSIIKGHVLNEEDLKVRTTILNLICRKQATIPTSIWENLGKTQKWNLIDMQKDGLLTIADRCIQITDEGMNFVRNICSQIDKRLATNELKQPIFSKAV
jgi:oxygen-independent coproporphyrinogen-3 oxidase